MRTIIPLRMHRESLSNGGQPKNPSDNPCGLAAKRGTNVSRIRTRENGVSLEQSLAELAACLRKLHEVFSGARLTIVEDQTRRKPAVVDAFGSRIEDALGNVQDHTAVQFG